MKINKFVGFTILILLSGIVNSYGQKSDHEIKVVARSYGDSIVLRWAPTTPQAWEAANKNGFYIVRYLLMKDSILQERPKPETLTSQALKPWPLEKWSPFKDDKFAAIAAQALFGKTFQLTTGNAGDVTQIYQKVRETELRFSLAMLAADISAGASSASALRYIDKNVKKGERYVYRVYTSSEKVKIDTGFCYIGTNDRYDLPKPYDLQGSTLKGSAILTWNKLYFNDIYSAFFVERSDDGKTYQRITELPLINTHTNKNEPLDKGIYVDSLPALNKKFFYRIRGINSFAELSPPSDSVVLTGVESLTATPSIVEAIPVNNNQVHLKWEFPSEAEKGLKKFKIERSTNSAQGYQVLKDSIPSVDRGFIDTEPMPNAYYRIKGVGIDGTEKSSLTHMVQLIDSIPPTAPKSLTGSMDSTGAVKLSWVPNQENDLRGYRVYRANFMEDEFFQITSSPVSDTVYYDTVSVKTLTKSIYYKIVAVDYNYNPSDFSEALFIKRYDRIPPVAPVFKNYKSSTQGVLLAWYPSSSNDVKETILLRRIKGQRSWKPLLVFQASDTIKQYYDQELSADRLYEYTLKAYDDSGLESKEATIVTAKKIDDGIRPPIKNIKAVADRQKRKIDITWEYNELEAWKFYIYRQMSDGETVMHATINGEVKAFTDNALKVGTKYTYQIKAICKDGGESPISENIVINY